MKNYDCRVHEIGSGYSVQWNKRTGYFEIRRYGKLVAFRESFQESLFYVKKMKGDL